MRKSFYFCVAVAVTCVTSFSSRAAIVANSLNETFSDGLYLSTGLNTHGGQAFNTGSGTLLNVVNLNLFAGTSGGTYDVELWDSNGSGGTPGAFILTLGNDLSTPTTSDFENVVSLSGLYATVSAATDYYIVVKPNTGGINWGYTASTSGVGFPSNFSYSDTGGTSWYAASQSDPQRLYIEVEPVPEPSTWLAAGFVSMLVVGRYGRTLFTRFISRG